MYLFKPAPDQSDTERLLAASIELLNLKNSLEDSDLERELLRKAYLELKVKHDQLTAEYRLLRLQFDIVNLKCQTV